MPIDPEAIRSLVASAGPDRTVTLDQIKSVLPIERLSPTEIAQAIRALEDAGVQVEVDDDLTRPHPGALREPDRRAPRLDPAPAPEPVGHPTPPPGTGVGRGPIPAAGRNVPPAAAATDTRRLSPPVLAVLAVIAVIVLVIAYKVAF